MVTAGLSSLALCLVMQHAMVYDYTGTVTFSCFWRNGSYTYWIDIRGKKDLSLGLKWSVSMKKVCRKAAAPNCRLFNLKVRRLSVRYFWILCGRFAPSFTSHEVDEASGKPHSKSLPWKVT